MRSKMQEDGSTNLWLSADDTWNWAHKPGAAWPCSTLAGNRVFVAFESNGDLVDFTVNGKDAPDDIAFSS